MKHLWYAKEDGIKELVGLWTDADIFKKVGDRNLWNINKKKNRTCLWCQMHNKSLIF